MTRYLHQSQQHRRAIMRLLLAITTVAACFYSIINFNRGVLALAVGELFYALFSVMMYRIVTVASDIRYWILFYVIPLMFLISYALYLPTTSNTLFTWIMITPVVLYLLLGTRLGMRLSIVFVSLNIVIYYRRFFSGELFSLEDAGIYNIIISSVAITVFAHIYERNRELTETRLIELAGTDALTRLPNRMKLFDEFRLLKATADRTGQPIAISMIDLDHFKDINDKYGHSVGDRALKHAAGIISTYTREVDLTARLGGEEFILVMPDSSAEEGKQIVDRLRDLFMNKPIVVNDKSVVLTFSAGVSQYGADGYDLETLIKIADHRLYSAKNQGRNRVIFSDAEIIES
ncbi:MAG: GGDEF domain-containing protein [Reinekea sp.]|jgi:diguanylate cyclase (GGDEF)-like protein